MATINLYIIDDEVSKLRSLQKIIMKLRDYDIDVRDGFRDKWGDVNDWGSFSDNAIESSNLTKVLTEDCLLAALNDPFGLYLIDVSLPASLGLNRVAESLLDKFEDRDRDFAKRIYSVLAADTEDTNLTLSASILGYLSAHGKPVLLISTLSMPAYVPIGLASDFLIKAVPYPRYDEFDLANTTTLVQSIIHAMPWTYHEDHIISEAIRFYAMPWIQKWPEKWIHGKKPGDLDRAKKALAQWLEVDVGLIDDTSYKGLLMFEGLIERHQWYQSADSRERGVGGYPIKGAILDEVLKILRVKADGIVASQRYRLPVIPGFPFLLSLREAAKELNQPPTVLWERLTSNNQLYTYRLEIMCGESDWGLRNRYYYREQHMADKAAPLDRLLRAEVNIVDPPSSSDNKEWRKAFEGIRKSEGILEPGHNSSSVSTSAHVMRLPLTGMSFIPGYVSLYWTAVG